MALPDTLTGTNLHFGEMKKRTNHQVCTALKTYVSSRLPEFPGGEDTLVRERNALYAFFSGAQEVLSENLGSSLARYKPALLPLDLHDHLCLISALHTGHVVTEYLTERESSAAANWFFDLARGICDIYGRPDSYMADWLDSLDWISESDQTVQARLEFKVYKEIGPILGLPEDSLRDCATWGVIGMECARWMRVAFDDPGWNEVVETELASH